MHRGSQRPHGHGGELPPGGRQLPADDRGKGTQCSVVRPLPRAARSSCLSTRPLCGQVLEMLGDVKSVFEDLVAELDWMDAATKAATLGKARAMRSFVGFPEWLLHPDKLDEYYDGVGLHRAALAPHGRRGSSSHFFSVRSST